MNPREGHPTIPAQTRDVTVAEVADLIRVPGTRFAVASHHNPDGDALGSMLALHRALLAAGFDSVMCHPDEDAIIDELAFMFAPGETVHHGPPSDAADRTLISVDCASAQRLWFREDGEGPHTGFQSLINIDHHHDNTRFGHHNLVVSDASSSAEVVFQVIEAAGWPITRDIAEPLYVGLITDTGRFCYSNTGVEAHRVAGELIGAGVEPNVLADRLYERQPIDRMLLMGRALGTMTAVADGRLRMAVLGPDDYAAAGGSDSEGIVEVMRSIDGCLAAGLAREVAPGRYRVSLRSATPALDVSSIARQEGGGGHRAAAGFSTTRPPDDLMPWLEEQVVAQLGTHNGADG